MTTPLESSPSSTRIPVFDTEWEAEAYVLACDCSLH